MEKIKAAVEGLLKTLPGVKSKVRVWGAVELWETAVETSGKSWAEKISGGVLFVGAGDPSAGQDIALKKNVYLKRLNGLLGEEMVKDLKVKIGTKPITEEKG